MYFQPGRSSNFCATTSCAPAWSGFSANDLHRCECPISVSARDRVPDGHAAGGLVAGEDVVELLDVQRRAVTEQHVVLAHLVGQLLQPLHVVLLQDLGVAVQRVAGGVVVVRVVHPPGDGGVVVAQDGVRHLRSHQRAGLVGAGAVADGVAQADVAIDPLGLERLEHRLQGFDVRVGIREDSVAHGRLTISPLEQDRACPACRTAHDWPGMIKDRPHARRRARLLLPVGRLGADLRDGLDPGADPGLRVDHPGHLDRPDGLHGGPGAGVLPGRPAGRPPARPGARLRPGRAGHRPVRAAGPAGPGRLPGPEPVAVGQLRAIATPCCRCCASWPRPACCCCPPP